jgi:hypothetical protein
VRERPPWFVRVSLITFPLWSACTDVWGFRDLTGTNGSSSGGNLDGSAFDGQGGGPDSASDGRLDAADSDAAVEAEACTCSAGISCFYSVSEPPSGYGAPYPVATVVLTPTNPSATWTETVHTPPPPYYDWQWTDVDVSAFTFGGTLVVGATTGSGCMVSTILAAQCPVTPDAGPEWLESAPNADAGSGWSFPAYAFGAGTDVLHIGSQGAWQASWCAPSCVTGGTNTNTVTVSVQ